MTLALALWVVAVARAAEGAPTPETIPAVETAPVAGATPPSKLVYFSDLSVRKRVPVIHPSPPDSPRRYDCVVRISVDEQGRVTDVAPRTCDEPWFDAARVALLQWEFRPLVVVGGAVIPVRADVTFAFRMRGAKH